MCDRHEQKEFIKYNLTEKRLLCEECLMSDRLRRSVIWEIEQGYEYEKDNFEKSCNLIEPIRHKIQTIYQLVFDSIQEIKLKFEAKANLIDQFYDDYRRMLDMSQCQVKNFLFLQTQKQIMLMETQKNKTEQSLHNIYDFVQFQNGQFSQVDFLRQVKSKYIVLQNLAQEIGTQVNTPNIVEFQKGTLFDNLTTKVKSKMGLQRVVRRPQAPIKKTVGKNIKQPQKNTSNQPQNNTSNQPQNNTPPVQRPPEGFFTEQELVLIFNLKNRTASRSRVVPRSNSVQHSRTKSLNRTEPLTSRTTQQQLKTMNFTQKTDRPGSRTNSNSKVVPRSSSRVSSQKSDSKGELRKDTSRTTIRPNIMKPPVSPIRRADRSKKEVPQKQDITKQPLPRDDDQMSNKIDRSTRSNKQSQSFIKQVQGFSNDVIVANMTDRSQEELSNSYQFNNTDQGFYKKEERKKDDSFITPNMISPSNPNMVSPSNPNMISPSNPSIITPSLPIQPSDQPIKEEQYTTIEAERMPQQTVQSLQQQNDDEANMSLADYYNHFISKEQQPLSESQSQLVHTLQQQHDSNTTLEMNSIFKDSHDKI